MGNKTPEIWLSQNRRNFKWSNYMSVNHCMEVINSSSSTEKLQSTWRCFSNIQELNMGHGYCRSLINVWEEYGPYAIFCH